jgi:hypothetical protein
MINPQTIQQATQALSETLIKKNQDYGNSVQEQFDTYGLVSIVIRLDDKLRRLKQLLENSAQVTEESIQDTLHDLAGYATLGQLCLAPKALIIEKDGIDPEKLKTATNLNTPEPWQVIKTKYDMNFNLHHQAYHPYLDPDDQH